MRNADTLGNRAGVMDVAAGTAGALAVGRRAVIVKLQRDADDVVAGVRQDRRGDRGIDAARHGDDHARRRRRSLDIEYVQSHAGVPGRRPMRPPPQAIFIIWGAATLRHGGGCRLKRCCGQELPTTC